MFNLLKFEPIGKGDSATTTWIENKHATCLHGTISSPRNCKPTSQYLTPLHPTHLAGSHLCHVEKVTSWYHHKTSVMLSAMTKLHKNQTYMQSSQHVKSNFAVISQPMNPFRHNGIKRPLVAFGGPTMAPSDSYYMPTSSGLLHWALPW